MEPYRAFIGDKLPEKPTNIWFPNAKSFCRCRNYLSQSFFICISKIFWQVLILQEYQLGYIIHFSWGSVCSIASVGWSVYKTPEIPPTEEELQKLKEENQNRNLFSPFIEIFEPSKICQKSFGN